MHDGAPPGWYVYAQRINAAGATVWGPVQLSSGINFDIQPPEVVSDGSGGAFIAFRTPANSRAVHVNSAGAITAPGLDGVILGDSVRLTRSALRGTTDGIGGAIFSWVTPVSTPAPSNFVMAQRVSLTPNLTLPWGAAVVISNDPFNEGDNQIAGDDHGGVLVTWSRFDPLGVAGTEVRVQRINHNGTPLWAANGVILVSSNSFAADTHPSWEGYEVRPTVASDNTGGAIVAWNDWRNDHTHVGNDDIFAQRIYPNGAPAWAANGVEIVARLGSHRRPQAVSDHAGGAIIAYQDLSMWSYDAVAARLNPSGIKLWTRGLFFDSFSENDPGVHQTDPLIVFDDSGPAPTGAVIVWDDERNNGFYAQKVEVNTSVAPPPAPTNLNANVAGVQIHVFWQDNSLNETGFRLEYKVFSIVEPPTWTTLATLNPNVTSYQLSGPVAGNTYKFRVCAFNNAGDSPYSNTDQVNWFVFLTYIHILIPNGNEIWAAGSNQTITWSNHDNPPPFPAAPTHVTIDYSLDGGSNWVFPPIAQNIPNTNSFAWTVPHTYSDNCIIRVKDAHSSLYDLSNEPFIIYNPDPATFSDCNSNGIPDRYDIQFGTSKDCNKNGFPDECEFGICSFVHYKTSSALNNWTMIDHPGSNGDLNAILFVTSNWNPGGQGPGVYNNAPIGVFNNFFNNWGIFNEDTATNILPGAAFNVHLRKPSNSVFVHRSNPANISFNYTLIDHPLSNNNPDAMVFATQNWNPDGELIGVYNNIPIGVWYSSLFQKWSVFNQDNTVSMPDGADFNIMVTSLSNNVFIHRATVANTAGHITTIDDALTNNNPNALILVTQNFNPGGSGGQYNNHPIGVYYAANKWHIFNQDRVNMPLNAAFNVMVLSAGCSSLDPAFCRCSAADFNHNGRIDLGDLKIFNDLYLTADPLIDIAPYPAGDGKGNYPDYALFGLYWLRLCSQLALQ